MRRHARQPFADQMQISWKDARGQMKNAHARCVDLSAEGACLETNEPIPTRTSVTVYSARHGSLGTASVGHCVRHTFKYSIGVEFTASLVLAGQARKRCIEECQAPTQDQP